MTEQKAQCPKCGGIRTASTPQGTPPRGPLSDSEVDDMAFGYCPSGAIGELRELIRAVERAHHVGGSDAG